MTISLGHLHPLPKYELSSREPVTFSIFSRFVHRPDVFQSPPKRRHPERSASQIYRITEGFVARSRRTSAMLVGRCSSELSGHRLQGKLKSHSLRAERSAGTCGFNRVALSRSLLGSSARLETRLVSARLHPVAAGLHVAPSPGVVLAQVEEEPSAGWVAAVLYQFRVARYQQIRGCLGQLPQWNLRLRLGSRPAPSQL